MALFDAETRAVLLVDDNPAVFAMYRDVLPAMSQFIILTAENGAVALNLIEARRSAGRPPLSCIVIDVLMPELDGLQLARALRGDAATAGIPLVILTALAQEKNQFMGLASGADQYLTKPVSVPDLLAAINTAIALSPQDRVERYRTLATDADMSL
jgi:CheY-like chemotaxis protein